MIKPNKAPPDTPIIALLPSGTFSIIKTEPQEGHVDKGTLLVNGFLQAGFEQVDEY